MADEHRQLDELVLVQPSGERRPGGIGDAVVVDHLVARAEGGGLRVGPQRRVEVRGDPGDLLVGQPGLAAQADVLPPLVGRVTAPRDAQDRELALARREPAATPQMPAEPEP